MCDLLSRCTSKAEVLLAHSGSGPVFGVQCFSILFSISVLLVPQRAVLVSVKRVIHDTECCAHVLFSPPPPSTLHKSVSFSDMNRVLVLFVF